MIWRYLFELALKVGLLWIDEGLLWRIVSICMLSLCALVASALSRPHLLLICYALQLALPCPTCTLS